MSGERNISLADFGDDEQRLPCKEESPHRVQEEGHSSAEPIVSGAEHPALNWKKRPRVVSSSLELDHEALHMYRHPKGRVGGRSKAASTIIDIAETYGIKGGSTKEVIDNVSTLTMTADGWVKEGYIVDDDEVESSLEESSSSSSDDIDDIDEEANDGSNLEKKLRLKQQKSREKLLKEVTLLKANSENFLKPTDCNGDDEEEEDESMVIRRRVASSSRYTLRSKIHKPITKIDLWEEEQAAEERRKKKPATPQSIRSSRIILEDDDIIDDDDDDDDGGDPPQELTTTDPDGLENSYDDIDTNVAHTSDVE